MRVADLAVLSLRQLGKNKLRSLLTVLGIVIGIAAVTVIFSIGLGGQALIQNQFLNLGSNVLIVYPVWKESGGVRQGRVQTLTPDDAKAIADECPAVRASCPIVAATGQLIGGNVNWKPDNMQGVGPDFLIVRNWDMATGDFFSDRDVTAANKVCVIGVTIQRKLFPAQDPIGQQIRITNIPFHIIGVLAEKGADLGGRDQDDIVLMPYTTARKRLQGSQFSNVDYIILSARSEDMSVQAEKEATALLVERHKIPPGRPNDFGINNTVEIGQILNAITKGLTAMLSSIAAISLLVGGVGIMNIMLVSVTERTKEIGLRMALGARPRDILRQFLIEAVVLSGVGALIGLGFGVGGAWLMTMIINGLLPHIRWPFVISIPAALVALAFAVAVGMFFGFYPALRASRLDPIEALRFE